MRLEREHDALAREGAARGLERRRHLRRVVAVVVDKREPAIDLSVVLKSAPDAVELLQRLLDGFIPDWKLGAHRDRGKRVQHVMLSRKVEHNVEDFAPWRRARNFMRPPSCAIASARTDASSLVP